MLSRHEHKRLRWLELTRSISCIDLAARHGELLKTQKAFGLVARSNQKTMSF